MKDKRYKITHNCKYMKTCKALDSFFPPSMKFHKIRRKIREMMLVSETNGRRCFSPQGTVGYMFEKEQHLTQNYYMIHPYSKFRQFWELVIIIETLVTMIVRVFLTTQGFFRITCTFYYQLFGFLLDVLEMADIVLAFLTGYVDKETTNVILERGKVFTHNLKSFRFYFTLITCFPLELIAFAMSSFECPHLMAALMVLLKIFRLGILTRYLVHIAKIYNWSEIVLRSIWLIIASICVMHWLSCLFYVILYGDRTLPFVPVVQHDAKSLDQYFHRHFKIFYLVSSIFFFHSGMLNQFYLTNVAHFTFSCCILVFTYLANIILTGLFVQYLGLLKTPLIHYEGVVQEVQKFLIQENLPKSVHKKVVKYFQFRYQFRYFREKLILETLSQPLKYEISYFLCKNILTSPQSIFANIPSELVGILCMRMKYEVFLSGDIIVSAGKRIKKVYFVSCGSAVAYSRKGRELTHLYDGDQFAEAAFATSLKKNPVTVIALELSEYLVLRYQDFMTATEANINAREIVTKAADEKLRIWSTMSERNSKY